MENKFEKVVNLCKRRGFVFQSSEIYGGLGGVYDFGPLGVALKNNLKKLWWKRFVEDRDDVLGIESAVLMNKKVWEASGHEKDFSDPLAECKKCHQRVKLDELTKDIEIERGNIEGITYDDIHAKCPNCGGEFTKERLFNLMFKTFIGPVEKSADMTYLRPETAQGMFVNFKNILETQRVKLPFGIAQIGKSFRNEITPKDFLYRIREFEIAEIEYFVNPGEDEKWFNFWLKEWQKFYLDLGIKKQNLKLYEHPKEDLSHYSKKTVDILYKFPFGEKELAGVANRTDFDLKNHEKYSKKNLSSKPLPYVIEPTLGIERAVFAILLDAYEEVEGGRTKTTESAKEKEIVLKLHPSLAPVKIAVLPLVKKLSKETKEIYQGLKKDFVSIFDEDGSIGRRYRRQDEIGTPFAITFDFDSKKDKKVTIRDRDTMKQKRVKIINLKEYLDKELRIKN